MMRAHPALKRMGSVMMWAGAAMIIGSAPESEQQGTRYASPAQTKSPERGFLFGGVTQSGGPDPYHSRRGAAAMARRST